MVGVRCSGSGGVGRLDSAVWNARLEGGPLFVVIPSLKHDEGRSIPGWEESAPIVKGVLEGIAATCCNVAIPAPRGLAVVELRPGAADNQLVWEFRSHGCVEAGQVLLSPIATVGRPTLGGGLHPGIGSVPCRGIRARQILLNQQWRWIPCIYGGSNLGPVGVIALGKDEDEGPPFVGQVGLVSGRTRGQV